MSYLDRTAILERLERLEDLIKAGHAMQASSDAEAEEMARQRDLYMELLDGPVRSAIDLALGTARLPESVAIALRELDERISEVHVECGTIVPNYEDGVRG